MSVSKRYTLGAAVLLYFLAAPAAADHDGNLDFRYTTSLFDYDVLFTASTPYDCTLDAPPMNADLNYFPLSQAIVAAEALDSGGNSVPGAPAGYHLGYTNLGFKAPTFNGESDEVLVYDCAPGGVHDDEDCDNGRATSTRIIMPSTKYCDSAEISIRRVMGHELFHKLQIAYGASSGAWGKVAFEGTARMMEDHVYSDIDNSSNTAFLREIQRYLDEPNQEFWRSSYQSALGWKHLAEQYGTTATEPQVGVDFIRTFWETVEDNNDNPDVPATIEAAIRVYSPEASLREWFHDFTIANIAKEFDLSDVSNASKYRYIDEDAFGISYRNVAREWTGDIQSGVAANSAIVRWGAAYFQADIGTSCIPGFFLGYRARNASDLRFAALAINNTDHVERLIRGGGDEFAVAFVQRDIAIDDPYEKLIAVVTGSDDQHAFSWAFDCGPGNLEVRLPDSTYRAFVGPNNSPRPLQIRLMITGPEALGDPTVLGLRPDDFTVYIGTNGDPADRADIISGAYVQGEYWLTVRPPVKPDENIYDLFVAMDIFHTDNKPDSVSYEQRIYDQVLVIDRSGSMGNPAAAPKIDAAKNAASLFVDLATETDQIGAVSFSDNATLEEALDTATDSQRTQVKDRIASIAEGGGTSIGDGLDAGSDQFALNGSTIGEDWMVLLSDGQENQTLFWTQVEAAIKAAGIRVNTIALGKDADQVLMQEIADETGGEYYYVDVGSLRAAGNDGLANRLADAYAAANESMKQRQRLWAVDDQLGTGQDRQYVIRIEGDGIIDGMFIWQWADQAHDLDVEILRPNGTRVIDGVNGAQIYASETHVVVQVTKLVAGDWTINLSATSGSPDYIGILSGDDRQGAELDVQFGQNPDTGFANLFAGALYLRGLPQPIRATLVDSDGIIGGADVLAEIEHPDGKTLLLPLFDDGNHDDGFPGDGVYGNTYTRTTAFSYADLQDVAGTGLRGSYNVVVEARGNDNQANAFTRIATLSFQVFETDLITSLPPSDSDGDGMPDRYEELHDCLDPALDDGEKDADDDGLSNLESYQGGWNPCHPDTDRGGETDVSELARGAELFDPRDDVVPRPIDAEVVDWRYEHLPFPEPGQLHSGANLIRYPVNPAYDQMRLLRSLSENGIFNEVAVFPAQANGGLYLDEGLVNGVTYYYRVQPIDINGNRATPSHVFSGRPNADPVPPIGSVRINRGAMTTTSLQATLSLTASSDTVLMAVSNDGSLDGVALQPYLPVLPWNLQPDPETGIATVFVRYRDAANNDSPTVYHAAIEVVGVGDVGTLRGFGLLEGQAAHANIFVQIVGPGEVAPGFTSANGVFTLRNVPPGSYDVKFSYPGYHDALVENVTAVAGATTFLGSTTLTAVDSDADGVADFEDNCTVINNPDQRDTNSDGIGNACDPDLDNDCIVSFMDLGLLKQVFFTDDDPDADFDGDGVTSFTDLGVMKQLFFQAPGPSATDCL